MNGSHSEIDLLNGVRAAAALPPKSLATRELEARAARSGKSVELGAYRLHGGGEREAALLANVALARAGFKPKLIRAKVWRRERGRVVEETRTLNLIHASKGQVLFDSAGSPFDGKTLRDLTAPKGTEGLDAGIIEELDGPRVFTPAGKPKTSGVTARVGDLTFDVVGRSSADRLFKEDEKNYQAAADEQRVPVEWLYFPFYLDGHTALRVGDKLYEFTRKGWRSHNARAFLFNNPYFDSQLARYPNSGIPPFSLGVPLTLAKRDAAAFAALAEAGRGWFSFWFNNCNQVPFRFLRRAGIALADGHYASFSSVRAFRKLLLQPPAQAGTPRLYPLPGRDASAEPLGPAVPRELVEERSVPRDALPLFWMWPKFLFDKLPQARKREG